MKKHSTLTAITFALSCACSIAVIAPSAQAHGNEQHKKASNAPISTDEHAFGREGDPKKVTRTINVDMGDNMRFSPSSITVKQGETVRFNVKNKGKAQHEMVLGTMDELKAHGELMKQNPGMEHDEPYMAHVAPGKQEQMVWQFTKAGDFNYGCLAPGHFESGMIGKVKVKKG
jgi:uncharacterized cupredoxin-like copper-binding protein